MDGIRDDGAVATAGVHPEHRREDYIRHHKRTIGLYGYDLPWTFCKNKKRIYELILAS